MKKYLTWCSFVSLCLCGFLSAADYEILEKSDTAEVGSASYATEHHLVTVKILTIEGADYREVIAVNSYIQIKNITASIRYNDGRIEKMRPEEFVELPLTMSADMLTDYKAVVISPQNLEPGCIVRIEYDRAISNLLYLNPWIYATSVPIKKAFYSIRYPSHAPIKYKGADASNLKVQKTEAEGKTTIMLGTSDQKEVTLIGSENFGSVEKKVVFMPEYCMTDKWPLSTKSWQDIAQWFLELSKYAYHDDPGMDAVVNGIVARYRDPAAIAAALFDYIQNNYGYVAIEIGIGGYKPHFASLTFKKKYGDCKDLTLLYLTLLRKAGIEGYPALVDTRSARFFDRDFPSPTQFNHCIAYLPRIRGGTWVDSTVKNFKFGEMPAVIQGKFALVAGGPNSLLKIPEDFMHANMLRMQFSGALSQNQLKMTGRVATEGQASTLVYSMQNAVMKNSIKHHVYQNLLLAGLPVQQLETELDGDRSLRLNFLTPISEMQPYKLLLVNAIDYVPLQQLVLDPQPQQFFALGNPLRIVVEAEIDLAGHRLVTVPFKKDAKGTFVTYTMQLEEKDGKLRYLADAFFLNGFLDESEMKRCQQELRDFSSLIQRTVVVQ